MSKAIDVKKLGEWIGARMEEGCHTSFILQQLRLYCNGVRDGRMHDSVIELIDGEVLPHIYAVQPVTNCKCRSADCIHANAPHLIPAFSADDAAVGRGGVHVTDVTDTLGVIVDEDCPDPYSWMIQGNDWTT